MKKVKKILFAMLIILIINMFCMINISNAFSIFGNDIDTTEFTERGNEQMNNMGIDVMSILDGFFDILGDVYLIAMGVGLVTFLIVSVQIGSSQAGTDGGKVLAPEQRKKIFRQFILLVALFGIIYILIELINIFI